MNQKIWLKPTKVTGNKVNSTLKVFVWLEADQLTSHKDCLDQHVYFVQINSEIKKKQPKKNIEQV